MLIFVLPTEKRLVVSFWTYFQISQQPQRIRKKMKPPKIVIDAGHLSKTKLANP